MLCGPLMGSSDDEGSKAVDLEEVHVVEGSRLGSTIGWSKGARTQGVT